MPIFGLLSIFDERYVQVIVGLAGLAVIVAIGVYVVGKIRSSDEENPQSTSEVMSTFRELYESGELSEEEYKNIKSKLSASLQQELKRPRKKDEES